jgi:hypothetical protein
MSKQTEGYPMDTIHYETVLMYFTDEKWSLARGLPLESVR